jgi:hypothetical protein
MKRGTLRFVALATASVALLTLMAPSTAEAHRWRGRGSVSFHFGYWPGWWAPWVVAPAVVYAAPRYYEPVYVEPAAPPVYVERGDEAAPTETWWYWCADARKYYPYVKECPGGWRRVPPQ